MKTRSEGLQCKYDIIVSALSQCSHHNKTMKEKRMIATKAMLDVAPDFSNEENADKELLIGFLALNNIITNPMSTDSASDLARKSMRQMMPNWAYEFGRDAFEGVPKKLVDLLEQLEDLSWHNDALPRFRIADLGNEKHWEIVVGYYNESGSENEFIFDICYFGGVNLESVQNEELRQKLGLPLSCCAFGTKGNVAQESFEIMIKFIENFCLADKKADFLAIVSEYQGYEE
ncbi:hypothetical protein F0M16_11050 [Vibrio cholerae]|uniref:Uncharacterized protein n=1 Tax=Vibrio cholerae TaxID=666 RepID=A0A5Q6PIY6_VIBCL|nr:hypothetical protein [Vibrio cholerae]KAA1254796.1 hypothetical protein F0M16_11050 [Vibrio cholerae]